MQRQAFIAAIVMGDIPIATAETCEVIKDYVASTGWLSNYGYNFILLVWTLILITGCVIIAIRIERILPRPSSVTITKGKGKGAGKGKGKVQHGDTSESNSDPQPVWTRDRVAKLECEHENNVRDIQYLRDDLAAIVAERDRFHAIIRLAGMSYGLTEVTPTSVRDHVNMILSGYPIIPPPNYYTGDNNNANPTPPPPANICDRSLYLCDGALPANPRKLRTQVFHTYNDCTAITQHVSTTYSTVKCCQYCVARCYRE
jgi:hypothetical protein